MLLDDLNAEIAEDQAGKQTLIEWMLAHRRQLEPDRPFDLDSHPYLRAIYQEDATRVVLYKASQVGISEYLISYALHACDQRRATVLYVFPTDTHVSDFSATRVGPAIEASPYLTDLVVDGSDSKRSGSDRVTLKRIRNRFLYFRGGTVKADGKAAQLKSIAADCLILDELDEMDPRAPAIARKRLGHSELAEERLVSTPTYPGQGIHAEWLLSDQREWFVKCERCGNRQTMTIHDVVTEWDHLGRPVAWHGKDDDEAWIACRKCGRQLNRLADGEWVATYPGRDLVGYHPTKFMLATASISEIVDNLNTPDETKRREAYNQDLGEIYVPRGGNLTVQNLDDARRAYGHGPQPGQTCYMGVDVGSVLHVVIRAKPDAQGERRQLFAGFVSGFDEVGRLIRLYSPRTVVIDALPETKSARALQADFPRRKIWLAYYSTQKVGSKKDKPIQWDDKELVAHLDRTRTLDETTARFLDASNTLPANARGVKDYYPQLTASVRVLERDAHDQEVARYIETGPDHFTHAENYCTAASECPFGGWTR